MGFLGTSMASLQEYWKKRNFAKTSEPKGTIKKSSSKKLVFVVHDHYARRHHYDLRLEMRGVLRSWAIPKLIDPQGYEKRLAVQTEDHAYAYKDFRGKIPEGQYGAGVVKIFDHGYYHLLEQDQKKIIFELHGKKLKGSFCLIKLKNDSHDKNWLFFKKK